MNSQLYLSIGKSIHYHSRPIVLPKLIHIEFKFPFSLKWKLPPAILGYFKYAVQVQPSIATYGELVKYFFGLDHILLDTSTTRAPGAALHKAQYTPPAQRSGRASNGAPTHQ